MLSWVTGNGNEITRLVRGRSNVYLISAAGRNVMVDSGHARDYNLLRQHIELLEPERRRIEMLILTHTHYDHCQNAARIKQLEHCKIVMGNEETDAAAAGYTTIPRGTSPLPAFIAWMGRRIGKRQYGYQPFEADTAVYDSLDLSDSEISLKIIATPGHSPGSVSILVDDAYALVGDAMFGIFGNGVFPPFADDTATLFESWGKLLATPCRTFLPGHGKPITRELLQAEYEKRRKGLE